MNRTGETKLNQFDHLKATQVEKLLVVSFETKEKCGKRRGNLRTADDEMGAWKSSCEVKKLTEKKCF